MPIAAERKIDWRVIITAIKSDLDNSRSWAAIGEYGNAEKYKNQAVTLIELLEINLCGSTGGFDKGQNDRSLTGRVSWLTKHIKY